MEAPSTDLVKRTVAMEIRLGIAAPEVVFYNADKCRAWILQHEPAYRQKMLESGAPDRKRKHGWGWH